MVQQDLFGNGPAPAVSAPKKSKPMARPRHTWFFALRPSADDAQRIHALAGPLLSSNGVTGKRIAPERLHITLALVGHDVDAEVIDGACRAADAVRGPIFEVRFESLMSFLAPNGPVVLLGNEGLDGVRKLRSDLSCAMADHGFTPSRAYNPHMTLCYDKRHQLASIPIQPISFRAVEFTLVKSHIGLSRHEVLRTWRLGNV